MQDDSTQIEVIDEDASRWLATIETADRALSDAVARADLPRLVALRNTAAALGHLAEQQRYAEAWQRQAAGIKLRSERAAGEILAGLERESGKRRDIAEPRTTLDRGSDEFGATDADEWAPGSQVEADAPPPTPYQQALDENDIPLSTAKRWQIEASLSEPAFENFMAETDEPTQAALLRRARELTASPKVPKFKPAPAPIANRLDVQQALALLDDLAEQDPERVNELRRLVRLIAKAAGLG